MGEPARAGAALPGALIKCENTSALRHMFLLPEAAEVIFLKAVLENTGEKALAAAKKAVAEFHAAVALRQAGTKNGGGKAPV